VPLLLSNNEVDVFGRGLGTKDQIAFIRVTNGAWWAGNLTTESPSHPKMASDAATIQTKAGSVHAFAPNANGEMFEFAKSNPTASTWFSQNLSAALPGNPKVMGVPSVVEMKPGELSVFARTTGNELISFERAANGGWTVFNETAVTGGQPHIAGNPAALVLEPSLYSGTDTAVYARNAANELISFDRLTNGAWVYNNETASAPGHPHMLGTPVAVKLDPSLYSGSNLAVFARNEANELISLDRLTNGAWVYNNETAATAGHPHMVGSPAVVKLDPSLYSGTNLAVFARNEANELISFDRLTNGAWAYNNETAGTPGQPHILGSPAVIKTNPAIFGTGLTVFARNVANELISFDRFMNGAWVSNNQSAVVGGHPLIE
jgi:hypothetical protein